MRAINGGPAKPTDKPPRPFQQGVAGLPTLVSNVETLANLPYLHRHGAEMFRGEGTSASPGTFLVTVTGAGQAAGRSTKSLTGYPSPSFSAGMACRLTMCVAP